MFHRTKRQVRLTEPGKVFLEEARQILLKAAQAVEVVRLVAQGERDRLFERLHKTHYCLSRFNTSVSLYTKLYRFIDSLISTYKGLQDRTL